MDKETEKACFEELSTLIFDANEKVSLKKISNNWLVNNKVAQEVLLKWLDLNKDKAQDLVKEYVVQGKNTKGVYRVTVVPEETMEALKNKWESFSSMLYSVDTKAMQSTRKLNLPDYEPIKVSNILLSETKPRDLHIPVIPIVKQEPVVPKKVEAKTPFSIAKTTDKKSDEKLKPKEEKISPETKPSTSKSPPVESPKEVKTEKKSPVESTKAPAGKKVQLKNQKPVGKGAISSFFNNKPSTSKPTAKAPVVQKEKSPVKHVSHEISSDEEMVELPKKLPKTPEKAKPAKKQPEKKKPVANKIKMKEKPTNKRSRIRVMEDSSEDEEEVKSEEEEPECKLIKFDREFTPERAATPVASPEKIPDAAGKSKRKAKRWVTKRYQSEDGFIKTERIQEEYSASEEENDENRKKNSPPKSSPKAKAAEKKKTPAKAKPTQAGKTKNANITSFFKKL